MWRSTTQWDCAARRPVPNVVRSTSAGLNRCPERRSLKDRTLRFSRSFPGLCLTTRGDGNHGRMNHMSVHRFGPGLVADSGYPLTGPLAQGRRSPSRHLTDGRRRGPQWPVHNGAPPGNHRAAHQRPAGSPLPVPSGWGSGPAGPRRPAAGESAAAGVLGGRFGCGRLFTQPSQSAGLPCRAARPIRPQLDRRLPSQRVPSDPTDRRAAEHADPIPATKAPPAQPTEARSAADRKGLPCHAARPIRPLLNRRLPKQRVPLPQRTAEHTSSRRLTQPSHSDRSPSAADRIGRDKTQPANETNHPTKAPGVPRQTTQGPIRPQPDPRLTEARVPPGPTDSRAAEHAGSHNPQRRRPHRPNAKDQPAQPDQQPTEAPPAKRPADPATTELPLPKERRPEPQPEAPLAIRRQAAQPIRPQPNPRPPKQRRPQTNRPPNAPAAADSPNPATRTEAPAPPTAKAERDRTHPANQTSNPTKAPRAFPTKRPSRTLAYRSESTTDPNRPPNSPRAADPLKPATQTKGSRAVDCIGRT
jgi:hypothetical protein